MDNPIGSTKKLLIVINEFSKVAGYKVNIQKSKAFLYSKNKLSERETKKTPIYHSNKIIIIKYLGINLTKLKDLSSENYRTLKKEIEEYTNKWKHILYSWIGRINIIKMSILVKAKYRFNTIPIKIPMSYFTDLEKIFQKFILEPKKAPDDLSNLEKEEHRWRDHII